MNHLKMLAFHQAYAMADEKGRKRLMAALKEETKKDKERVSFWRRLLRRVCRE